MRLQADAINPSATRRGWDVRAWRFGLVSSSIVGLTFSGCFEYSSFMGRSDSDVQDIIVGVALLLGGLVLPGILAGIARRRWLLWAYLPYGVIFCSLILTAILDTVFHLSPASGSASSATSSRDVWIGMTVVFSAPLVSALPVTLVRLRIAANRARQAARLAFEAAQYTIERVGVWPPAPVSPPTSDSSGSEALDNRKYH